MAVWRGFGGILGECVFGSRIFDVGHSQEDHLRPKAITDVSLCPNLSAVPFSFCE